jgi:putative membrane protein
MRLIATLLANALGLLATAYFVPGISFTGDYVQLGIAALIMALFNMIVRPIAMLLSLPFIILTLGIFYFVVNGILLWAVSLFISGYTVQGVIPAGILGALVLGIVNWLVHAFVGKK